MSVLNATILSALLPDTKLISTLSYDSVFFGNSVKPCSFKSLVKYSFLSVAKDFSAFFTDRQFQCVNDSNITNPFVSTYTTLDLLSFTCECNIVDNNTQFTFVPNYNINGVIQNAYTYIFLQYYDSSSGTWQNVIDSATGNPFADIQPGSNVFEPQIDFPYGSVKFKLINTNNNIVSPAFIVNVVECSSLILMEDSSYILQEDSSRIKTE